MLLFVFTSCSFNKETDNNIEIIINEGASYRYDLKNEIYTVFNSMKPTQEIKFELTSKEKQEIINAYYRLDINDLPNEVMIKDNCSIMPKIYTTIFIRRKNQKQKIQIDDNCGDFEFSNSKKAKEIKEFIRIIKLVLYSKSVIRNAPKSDIFYL